MRKKIKRAQSCFAEHKNFRLEGKKIFVLASMTLMMAACGNNGKEFDATGTFEATETIVFAEQNGVLMDFSLNEGENVEAGAEVGLIDTTQIWLKIRQLGATKEVYRSQKPDMEVQIATTHQQLAKAQQEQRRYKELVADGAAPSKMLDDAMSQVQVLRKQLIAQQSALATNIRSLDKQMAATDVQVEQLYDQLRKCRVVTPAKGTVLEKYVERGEFVAIGKPLFKIADVQDMYMRAYVTSVQLQDIKLGQKVKVFADYGNRQKKEYDGIILWISARSEFTPKTILTDDERADLVYAVKVGIKNDGFAKIGMYGEVKF